jgi:hypothetical protein
VSNKTQATFRRERIFAMRILTRRRVACTALCVLLSRELGAAATPEPDSASVIRMIDAEVQNRFQTVLGFTDIEHYQVFRGGDETHPVAEMTAKDTYRKGAGKTYTVLSRGGSEIVQRFGLKPLLDSEARISNPATVAQSWFTSANYEMKLKPGGIVRLNGRDCYVLSIHPRRTAPNLIEGTLWVDAQDGSIAQVEGVASRSPSAFAGTTHMMRQYSQIDGFPMATHARAESSSMLFGRSVMLIDYSDYHLQIAPHK